MNFFETLLHPDREELKNKDRSVVAAAANLLQIGEFQLLQLAFRDWHGRDLPTTLIDQLFASYMLENEVPHWARHYARKILADEKLGLVNDNDPAYHCFDNEYRTTVPRGFEQFCLAVAIMLVTVGGSIVIADFASTQVTSVLPPYFERDNLRIPVNALPPDLPGMK